ncbi:MAG: protein kinase, partial [Acidobacteriota bacterium]|nr:protein kinase [Acidobacteriota bacterium]
MIGKTLNQYRITAKLGSGGMGDVYLAEDTRLKREVALKILPERLATDPERRDRFEREAQAVAALNHPNIVTIHQVEECDGVFYIAMERVEGQSLGTKIGKDGMSLQELFAIAVPLTDAVGAAHDKGITHRDLKPDNVMISDDGRVKVLDFGLAKLAAGSGLNDDATATVTAEGRIVGTVAYMSPEQAEGKPVDARSDVFSLGILLYEMTTGKRPFAGDTAISTISSIMKDTPGSLTDLDQSLPRHLDRIVKRCLNKDAGRRYSSARELRNELEQLKGEIDSGESDAVPRPGRPWWKLVAALAVAAVVIVLIVQNLPTRTDDVAPTPAATETREMIVVLPFQNVGGADDEFFAAGVTEEITTRLSTVGDLGVISSESAQRLVDGATTTREIGERLGVDYVLQGTVRWAGSGDAERRVRITPKLIRVADGTQVWAESYDETVDDIFTVQSRIARAVIDNMGLALGAGSAVERPTTHSVEAWQAYLRGQEFADTLTPESLELASLSFESALELDPQFVDAWARLSLAHSMTMHVGIDTSAERDARALEAVENALRLEPHSYQARLAKGFYHYWGHKDYDLAMEQFDSVLAELPNHADALGARAYVSRRRGDMPGARVDLQRVLELDPLGKRTSLELALTEIALGDYASAREHLQKPISQDPSFAEPHFWLWESYRLEGRVSDCARVVQSVPAIITSPVIEHLRISQKLLERDPETALTYLRTFSTESYIAAPLWVPAALLEGQAQLQLGNPTATRAALQTSLDFLEPQVAADPDSISALAALAVTYGLMGRDQDALRVARHAVEVYGIERDTFFGVRVELYAAQAEALAGETDAAVDRLE